MLIRIRHKILNPSAWFRRAEIVDHDLLLRIRHNGVRGIGRRWEELWVAQFDRLAEAYKLKT
jgi:hypothetical protein